MHCVISRRFLPRIGKKRQGFGGIIRLSVVRIRTVCRGSVRERGRSVYLLKNLRWNSSM